MTLARDLKRASQLLFCWINSTPAGLVTSPGRAALGSQARRFRFRRGTIPRRHNRLGHVGCDTQWPQTGPARALSGPHGRPSQRAL